MDTETKKMDTPLIKFHTLEIPDPPATELTPEELAEETNPESEAGNE